MQNKCSILLILIGILFSPISFAQIATSSSYKVDSQTFSGSDDYATSTNYSIESAILHYGTEGGTSTNYNFRAGFISTLEYNYPSLSASAGTSQVVLDWTAVQGIENVTYEAGYSGGTGGPYTYMSDQSTTVYTRTGISPSTNQYYIIRAKDGSGNIIGYSNEMSMTSNGASGGGGSSFSSYYPPAETYDDEESKISPSWQFLPILPSGEVAEGLGGGDRIIYDSISGGNGMGGIVQATPEQIMSPPIFTVGESEYGESLENSKEAIAIETITKKDGNFLIYISLVIVFIIIFWWIKRKKNFRI